MRTMMALVVVSFIFLSLSTLWAEEVLNSATADGIVVYANFDVDPMFAFGAGIAKGRSLKFINRDILVAADVAVPMFLVDLNHWEFNVAGRIRLFDIGFLSFVNRLGFFMMTTSNDLFSGITVGFKETILIGHRGRRFYTALEAEYDKDVLTYLANSDLYRAIYPDAKDGW